MLYMFNHLMRFFLLFILLLFAPVDYSLSQEVDNRFETIAELLATARRLKADAAETLLQSVDVISIAKAQIKNGTPHYLGDARYTIEFPGLFETFSGSLRRGKDYTLASP